MFQVCDVVLINKIDVLPYFDFDMDKCREYIAMRNPNAKVIPICAKTGEGIAEWTDWLREQVKAWQHKGTANPDRLQSNANEAEHAQSNKRSKP